jgi:polysaccharide export outer membrane protein
MAEPDPGDYRVGVEDVLRIVVWGETQLSGAVTVRPDGKITIPLASDIKVDGLTPEQVRDLIAAALSDYVRDPNVTVVVQSIRHWRVYYLGEINQGTANYTRKVRLLHAIAERGGLGPYSNKKLTVVRDEDGVEKRIEVDFKKLLAGDPSQPDLYLQPGDVIIAH